MICLSKSIIDISTMGQQMFCLEDCIRCNVLFIDSKKKNYIDISNSSCIVLLSDLFLSLKRSRAQSRKVTTTSALGTEYFETTFVTITFTFTIFKIEGFNLIDLKIHGCSCGFARLGRVTKGSIPATQDFFLKRQLSPPAVLQPL